MPPRTLNSRLAREQWRDLLDQAMLGRRTIITRDDKPIAAVVGLADLHHLETPMPTETAIEYDPARAISAHALGLAQGDPLAAIRLLGDAIAELVDRATTARGDLIEQVVRGRINDRE